MPYDENIDANISAEARLPNAIGSFIVNFALFNSRVNSALTAAFNLTIEQARAFVLPMHPRTKLELIQGYAKAHLNKDTTKEINELCETAKKLANYRNSIAHGDLVSTDDPHTLHLYKYTGAKRFNPQAQPLRADEVEHNAMHAIHLSKEFLRLGELFASAPAQPQERPPQPSK